jgi:hypothetical protein
LLQFSSCLVTTRMILVNWSMDGHVFVLLRQITRLTWSGKEKFAPTIHVSHPFDTVHTTPTPESKIPYFPKFLSKLAKIYVSVVTFPQGYY